MDGLIAKFGDNVTSKVLLICRLKYGDNDNCNKINTHFPASLCGCIAGYPRVGRQLYSEPVSRAVAAVRSGCWKLPA